MKKLLSLLLAFITVFSLFSCSVRRIDDSATDTAKEKEETVEPIATAMPETTSVPETTSIPETTSAPETEPPTPPAMLETEGYPAVLMYHLIPDEPYTELENLFVRVSEFEEHLKYLKDAGYTFLFADEFGKVDRKSVIITLDDGYEDNYTNMFPLLKKYNAKATVYMIADKVDKPRYMTSDMIREMASSGYVQFGSHTVYHNDLTVIGSDMLETELSASKKSLASLTGQEINTVSYPGGAYNDSVIGVASKYYKFAYTTEWAYFDGENDLAIPRFGVRRDCSADGLRWILGD